MIFVPFLLAIPGSIAMVLAMSRLSPWEFSNRITPLLMILACLLLMFCPLRIELALAAAPIAALIAARLGFDFTGHEAANWSWLWTVPPRVLARFKRAAPVPLQEFLTRAYPRPDGLAVAPVAPVARSRVPNYVPEL